MPGRLAAPRPRSFCCVAKVLPAPADRSQAHMQQISRSTAVMNVLRDSSVQIRVQILTALSVVGLLAVMLVSILQMNRVLTEGVAAKLQGEVEAAYSILAHYEAEERAGRLTREQAQHAAKETLRVMRYDGKNYFFMIDMTPKVILLPFKPEMEGREVGDFKDANGFKNYAAMVAIVQSHGAGTVGYHWQKPDSQTIAPKLSYVKGFAPWGWIVGTGAYLDDVGAMKWWHGLQLGGLCALIAIMATLAGLAVARGITGPVRLITARMRALAAGDSTAPVPFTELANEFGDMGRAVSVFRDGLVEKERLEGEARERTAAELAQAAENGRIRSALDHVAVGVTLADLQGKVVYANPCGTALFKRRQKDLRLLAPQFDADHLMGTSLDWLPTQRNTNDSGSRTADLTAGSASLRVVANPVTDSQGNRLGTVVQWIDRTEEIAMERELEATVARAIDGDLAARVPEENKAGFFKNLAGGMNRLVQNMAFVLTQISTAALEVDTGAKEISRGNSDLSKRTEEQASSLEDTASSMEQMTGIVKNNADNAAQADQLARAARDQAEKGGSVVQAAVVAMREIEISSKKIADIISVIDAIAFQTNLLALNAAVESARAGEHGRGFAVVASEVRTLASRSGGAAKEISLLIEDSVSKVGEGAKLVDASGRVFQEIISGVKKVTDIVAEIAASSQEQASGIEQVNRAVTSMDEATQQNAALVEQATAAAHVLTEQAANLRGLIENYRISPTGSPVGSSLSTPAGRPAAADPRRRRSA